MERWSGKVVAITGGTSGVGRASAIRFAEGSASVAVIARGSHGLEAAAKDIAAAGGQAMTVEADVADAEQVEDAAARIEHEIGPIDVWVNDAMTTVFAPFDRITAEEFQRVTEVTYLGFVHGTMAALRRMKPRDQGTIVQVGSALAHRSIPLQSAYCGAKHAIQGFTQSLRCELLHERSHVRVTTVHLPALNTPQFDHCLSRMPEHPQPVPPIYQPEVAARAIEWAARHHRREVWVGAPTVGTILANRLAPGLLDRYLGRTNVNAQQAPELGSQRGTPNLWVPEQGDPGVHGDFDRRSHARSAQLWITERRPWAAALGGTAAAMVGLAAIARARR
jgi:NAD(P)-dependent dehydrogenase (short-subunit alcohol dehydrogenase family)